MLLKAAFTGIIVLLVPTITWAKAEPESQERYEKRMHKETLRIRKGFKKGSLTREEAADLRTQERAIKADVKAAMADGKMDDQEAAAIEAKQDILSAKIKLQKADNQEGKKKSRGKVRQFSQHQRLEDGEADGSLTDAEAESINDYIADNAKLIKELKADGDYSAEDKAKVEARQDITSAKIYLLRHNAERDVASVK